MRIFLSLTIDKIFWAIFASIYCETGVFCAHSGNFQGDFQPWRGDFSRGTGRDRHGETISTKDRDRHGDTGKQSPHSWQSWQGLFDRGKQAGNRQGQAGQAKTGKRQHNRVLCGLLRLKSNITSKQPYPSHPTSWNRSLASFPHII